MIAESANRILHQRYELRELLGEGRSGQAYRVWDRQTREEKAVKLIDLSRRRYPLETVLRFRTEAQTLQSFDHPGIIHYHDFFEEAELAALVMEYFPAPTLRETLRQTGPLPLAALTPLLQRVAEALAYVHERGVVHHDLKPANILTRLEGETLKDLRILDFGLAQLSGVQDGAHAGSLAYMSPEQTGLLHKLVDHRADLYALGVILYEAACGSPPFQHSDPAALMHLHVAGEVRPLRELRPDLPPALDAVVQKLLSKDPNDRYRTTGGLLRDLERMDRMLQAGNGAANFTPGEEDHWQSFPKQSPFVGRVAELATALEFLSTDGSARALLIESEGGGGRSRFLAELYNRSSTSTLSRWQVQIRREESRTPFRMAGELIARVTDYLRQRPEQEQANIVAMIEQELGERFGYLLQLAPGLRAWLSSSPPTARPWQEADYRFVLASFLRQTAQKEGGMTLYLDDLHNSDLDSIRLLVDIVRNELRDHNLRVVASIQPAQSTLALRQIVENAPADRLRRLRLDPLTEQEAADFLQRTFSGRLTNSERLLGPLLHSCGGNPAMLRAALQELTEQRALRFENGAWRSDEEQVSAILSARTEQAAAILPKTLSEADRDALARAAVFQRAFTLDALFHLTSPAAAGQDGSETNHTDLFADRGPLLELLDRAVAASVLSVDGRQLYSFTRPELRLQLKQSLSAALRQDCHRRVALYLEQHILPESSEARYDIAYHREQSGDMVAAALAAYAAAKLSDDSSYTNRQAQHYYNLAARCLMRATDATIEADTAFEIIAGAVQHNLQLDPLRADIAEDLERLTEMAGDDAERRIRVLSMRAYLAFYTGARKTMVNCAEQAFALDQGGRFQAQLLPLMILIGSTPSQKSYAERAELLKEAIEIALRHRSVDQLPPALSVYTVMLAYLGRFEEARAFVARVPAILSELKVQGIPMAEFTSAVLGAEIGDFDAIVTSLSLEWLDSAQLSEVGRRLVTAHGARALGLSGRVREALQLYEKLFAMAGAPSTRGELGVAYHGRIWLALLMQDAEGALDFAERALNHLRIRPDAYVETMIQTLAAHAAIDLSQIEAAEERIAAAQNGAARLHSPLLSAHIAVALHRAAAYRMRTEEALQGLEAAIDHIGGLGAVGWQRIYRDLLRNWRLQSSDSSSQSLRLRTENRELFQLIDLSRKISSTLDLDELMQETLKGAMSLAGAQQGYLFLTRPDPSAPAGHSAELRFVRDALGRPVPRERLLFSQQVVDFALQSRASVLLRDAREEPRWQEDPDVQRHQLRSVLATPILLRDRPLGLIYLDNRQASSVFTLHDREITETFASQAAIAIHNARLFEAEQLARQRTEATLQIFERFIPRQFTERFAGGELERLQRGLSRRERLGVLFSDLRDFTSLSETLSPEETFALLNDYLERMESAVRRHGGFVDKFIGDAVMALFDGPPVHALRAGVDMLRELQMMNTERIARGETLLRSGIGVHWGETTLGVIGSRDRLDTTAVGDVVNASARLESLTKTYGSSLLASGAVCEELPAGEFELRFLDMVQVKGKNEAIAIYETLNQLPNAQRQKRRRSEARFAAARNLYLAGQFEEAASGFASILAADPDDGASAVFLERCQHLSRLPPGEWDGIYRLSSK